MERLASAEWIGAPSGGAGFAIDTADKLVLHTTEGGTIEGAISAYRSHGAWPHFTCDPLTKRLVQHIPMNRAASALFNGPQPMETNRSGDVIQVEIVGRAANTHTYSDEWYRWLATQVVRPICDAKGIPPRITRFFGAMHGTIAVESWPGRMQDDRFPGYQGILGHQTIGDGNDHWDPGALDSVRILLFGFPDLGGEIYDPVSRQTFPVGSAPGFEDNELNQNQSQAFDVMVGVLTPTYPPFGRPVSLADIYDSAAKNFGALHQSQAVTNSTLATIAATLRSIDSKLSSSGHAVSAGEVATALFKELQAALQ